MKDGQGQTKRADLSSMTLGALREYCQKELGQPAFRAGQIYGWLHQKRAETFEEMTDLPAALRERLGLEAKITALTTAARQRSKDGTEKFLFGLEDQNCVETVLMRHHHGLSLCISSQVGCRMGCRFCASTIGGLVRNLTPGELIGQVHAAMRESGERPDSLVMMGIGEPLDNFDNLLIFFELLSEPKGFGMSLRHLSLSTCGLCDGIDRLAGLKLGLTLSVSLHAPENGQRDEIMPVNRRYPIERLMESCKAYFEKTGRRISYEYALIAGKNDRPEDADRLAALLKGQNCHINLIPVNPVVERGFRRPPRPGDFARLLGDRGLNATIRRELGTDIDAACGQLRRQTLRTGGEQPCG